MDLGEVVSPDSILANERVRIVLKNLVLKLVTGESRSKGFAAPKRIT